ncbi:MAG: biotin/lipoate A/B protein ligase family protein [Thermodesulfovibrionales bacterium]|nr:biotin/lipoate A/B protein ligase family protein [Thermodesulfovibrionales bacterium]
MNNSWRYIDEGVNSASYNMALDEALAIAVRKELAPPTLRLYGWDRSSVTIGFFQRSSDIDAAYCAHRNIPVVRRPSGGRAILHGEELTYSFSAKTDAGIFSSGLLDSYAKISKALELTFARIGIVTETKRRQLSTESKTGSRSRNPLCFHSASYGEISFQKRKIIGSAQKRWRDGLLQQGSIPAIISYDEVSIIFRCADPKSLKETMCGLREIVPFLTIDGLKSALRSAFEEVFDIQFKRAAPSAEETRLAEELEERKYSTHQWNFQR